MKKPRFSQFSVGAHMGRFDSTARIYAKYRQPYPPAFFTAVAERLGANGSQALIDLGCGPGLLALGFAPFVATVTGVDPEPSMLEAARAAAADAGAPLALIEGRTETLPADLGPFDVATIGRALHWMDRIATIAALDRILKPGGAIVVAGSRSVESDERPWVAAYDEMRRSFTPDEPAERYRIDLDQWTAESPFAVADKISVTDSQRVDMDYLFQRVLTMSSTSIAVIGDVDARRAAFDLAMTPFFDEGSVMEIFEASATIIRRRG